MASQNRNALLTALALATRRRRQHGQLGPVHPDKIHQFVTKQTQLLGDTYDQAWRTGVENYGPHEKQPTKPDGMRKAIALTGALGSLQKMTGELATLSPTTAQIEVAGQAVDAGTITPDEAPGFAFQQAMTDWAAANAYRLDGGESAAWSGEQDGYGQSAAADQALLEWDTEGDDHVCDDCEALGDLPPMTYGQWPTTPGGGATECSYGCRCALEANGDVISPSAGDVPYTLTDVDNDTINRIAGQVPVPIPDYSYFT